MAKVKTILIPALIVVGILAFIMFAGKLSTPFIEPKFYDANSNPIETNTLSIVNGVEGVKYVSFNINIK